MTRTEYTRPSAHDLLIRVRDVIRDRSWAYDQRSWYNLPSHKEGAAMCALREAILADEDASRNTCKTTACVAGLAVILGEEPGAVFDGGGSVILPSFPGLTFGIDAEAGSLLGLSGDQSWWLFAGYRSRDAVLAALDMLIEDPGARIWAIEDYEDEEDES